MSRWWRVKTLAERLLDANADLHAARRDGHCERIIEAMTVLNALLDEWPRAVPDTN